MELSYFLRYQYNEKALYFFTYSDEITHSRIYTIYMGDHKHEITTLSSSEMYDFIRSGYIYLNNMKNLRKSNKVCIVSLYFENGVVSNQGYEVNFIIPFNDLMKITV